MARGKKKLKIAIFHLGFFFSGGGEKLVLQEALGLTKRGHEVSLFAPVVSKKDCFPDLTKNVKINSLFSPFSFRFPLRDFISIFGAVFLTPLTFSRFKKYDVFFGANQPGPLICFLLSKILKKPYVIYLAQPTRLIYPRKIDLDRGFGKGSFNIFFLLTQIFKPLVKYLDKVSIESADVVLINGDYMKGVIEKFYKVRAVVCPAGSNTTLVRRTKSIILITNRHFHQKRLDYAIIAFSKIAKRHGGVSMIITGAPTAYTIKLKRLASRLNLKDRVIFTNLVSEEKLSKLYSEALVYLYTSPEEDFGMGVIEAMGAGVPVVAWNKAGPGTTIVSGKTGYLIKPYKLDEFAKKLQLLISDTGKNKKMGRAAREHVRKNYSLKKHNDILEKVFLSICLSPDVIKR